MAKKKTQKKTTKKPTKKKTTTKKKSTKKKPATREERRAQVREIQAAKVHASQEIAPLPPVVDPARRERSRLSLLEHIKAYHAAEFTKPLAPYHHELIERIEGAMTKSEWSAMAVPRGGGKSSLLEVGCEWALLHGHRRFVLFLGATDPKARQRLSNVKIGLRINPLLLEDFPETCYPIAKVERSYRRMEFQRLNGTPTAAKWKDDRITLPTVRLSSLDKSHPLYSAGEGYTPSSGAICCCAGITGDIRGFSLIDESGNRKRPDLVLADDVQTRESAKSPTQCDDRIRTLEDDCGYVGGLDKRTAMLLACTVMFRSDLADVLTDRDKKPDWHGVRHKLLPSMPTNMDLWEKYRTIMDDAKKQNLGPEAANQFYIDNRAELDAGAVASWEHRYYDDEIGPIQHGMNAYLRNPVGFSTELQNEPVIGNSLDDITLAPTIIASAQSELPRTVLPYWTEHLVAGIDVGQEVLWWVVAAVDDDFRGQVVSYGSFPDQRKMYYSSRDITNRISERYHGSRLENRISRAVKDLIDSLCRKPWIDSDGQPHEMNRILIDGGWKPAAIAEAIYNSQHGDICSPSKGLGVTAKDVPFAERTVKQGNLGGHGWQHIVSNRKHRINVDSNTWKSEVHRCFGTADDEPGNWRLYSVDDADEHRMFAEHLTAEYSTLVRAKDREVYEWSVHPGKVDNHLLDATALAMVAASLRGAVIPGCHVGSIGQLEHTKSKTRIRFVDDDPDALPDEYDF